MIWKAFQALLVVHRLNLAARNTNSAGRCLCPTFLIIRGAEEGGKPTKYGYMTSIIMGGI